MVHVNVRNKKKKKGKRASRAAPLDGACSLDTPCLIESTVSWPYSLACLFLPTVLSVSRPSQTSQFPFCVFPSCTLCLRWCVIHLFSTVKIYTHRQRLPACCEPIFAWSAPLSVGIHIHIFSLGHHFPPLPCNTSSSFALSTCLDLFFGSSYKVPTLCHVCGSLGVIGVNSRRQAWWRRQVNGQFLTAYSLG